MSNWPFGNLTPQSYDMLMVDPPWSFKTYSENGNEKGAKAKYSCMSLDDIAALPVKELASKDCLLLMWATNPMLIPAIRIMESWGFTYKTAAHWVKKTKHGKIAFGTGYLLRCAGEPLLIGTIGKPKTSRSCRTIIEGLVREHSRKPDEAFGWAERLMPEASRAEIFSRENRPGWDCWGDEAGKFDGTRQAPSTVMEACP